MDDRNPFRRRVYRHGTILDRHIRQLEAMEDRRYRAYRRRLDDERLFVPSVWRRHVQMLGFEPEARIPLTSELSRRRRRARTARALWRDEVLPTIALVAPTRDVLPNIMRYL